MGEPLAICHLNGDYLPLREARISPLDRGFLYSDGCYDVTPIYGGRPFRFTQHHDRLTRSLKEIRMEDPLSREAWREIYRQLIARNGIASSDAYIYVQVTRGAEYGRNHAPLPDVPPVPKPTHGQPDTSAASIAWIGFREQVWRDAMRRFNSCARAGDPNAKTSAPLGESFRRGSAQMSNLDYFGLSRGADQIVHSYDFFWHIKDEPWHAAAAVASVDPSSTTRTSKFGA